MHSTIIRYTHFIIPYTEYKFHLIEPLYSSVHITWEQAPILAHMTSCSLRCSYAPSRFRSHLFSPFSFFSFLHCLTLFHSLPLSLALLSLWSPHTLVAFFLLRGVSVLCVCMSVHSPFLFLFCSCRSMLLLYECYFATRNSVFMCCVFLHYMYFICMWYRAINSRISLCSTNYWE